MEAFNLFLVSLKVGEDVLVGSQFACFFFTTLVTGLVAGIDSTIQGTTIPA